jgi:hypothetical protein
MTRGLDHVTARLAALIDEHARAHEELPRESA